MEGNCAVDGAHAPFRQVVLNETNMFFYRGRTEQSFPFLFKVVSVISGASVNVVDDNFGSC